MPSGYEQVALEGQGFKPRAMVIGDRIMAFVHAGILMLRICTYKHKGILTS